MDKVNYYDGSANNTLHIKENKNQLIVKPNIKGSNLIYPVFPLQS